LILLAMAGCGAASGSDGSPQHRRAEGNNVQVSSCGARNGIEFKLHHVDCETANTLIVMLDGRALHQSVILMAEGQRRGVWVCISPTHSLVDPLYCRQGRRSFEVVTRAR
jgi:hypothetical protein